MGRAKVWNSLALVGLLTAVPTWGCSSDDSNETKDTNVQTDTQPDDTVSTDVEQDLATADEQVGELPTLPKDKTFSTAFAAGAADRIITGTKDGILLGGYGLCLGKMEACRVSGGVHDDLHAAAVALAHPASGEVVIFVGIDSVGMLGYDIQNAQAKVPEAFATRLGIKMDAARVVIGASHCHDAPDTVGVWGPMEGTEREEIEYIHWLQDQIVDVAIEAYSNLGDIDIKWGIGTTQNYDGDSISDDKDLFVMQGKRPNGDPVFTWVRGNAHLTVYPMENNGISADWVGAMRKKLNENNIGVVVYNNGPIGSVYPSDPESCTETDAFPEGWQDPDLKPEDVAKVTCIGYRTADEALAVLNGGDMKALDPTDGIKFRHTRFEFHPTNMILMQLGIKGTLPIPHVDVTDETQMMEGAMSWVTLGDLEILTTPGESFPSFALHGKDVLSQVTDKTIMVLGLTQDWMGYLLPVELWGDSTLGYNKSLSPGETIEPAFLDALQAWADAEKK